MSKADKSGGKAARGGRAGHAPAGRKSGYGSGRDQKAPGKAARGKDKPGTRDK